MQLGRVFISSVFGGMLDLRQSAAEAARLVGLEPVLTEHHVAQPASVRDALAREIAACDTYVGLFHVRRGTVPKGSDEDRPRAITEQELLLARELGLRCLVFLSTADSKDRDPELRDFLDTEVTDYHTGVWTRLYADKPALRREIAAGLAALRPRVVLELAPGAEGLAARLHLHGVAPAWRKETRLGPEPVRLALSDSARPILTAFRRGEESRSRLEDDAIRFLGQELGTAALPGRLGEALAEVLDLAAGRLVTLEIRTADSAALALPWELIGLPGRPLPVREGAMEVVRRIPVSGDSPDPLYDPAPTIPAEHLAVLGFTASPLEEEAGSELFWEREQESLLVALEDLLRESRGRLILPDTGEKADLQLLLSRVDRPQVVHIACHGGVHQDRPVLFLEDADGKRAPLGADELLPWCLASGEAPAVTLLVLAACSTAGSLGDPGPDDEATGLAETLVRNGLLRVLGMQSTVSDAGATAFAEKFYARLAEGADLSQALRAGRIELRAKGLEHEWAVPTLTTRGDAGPLVAPKAAASRVKHPFEAARGAFEVEGVTYLEEGYVGRRDAERRLRRAFEEDRLIAIHGLGGIGKSTLAARFLERRLAEGWRVLVLYAGRELAPSTVFEEVTAKLGLARPAGVSSEDAEALLREALKQELRKERTVLFLDNFEDNQDDDGQLRDPLLGKVLLEIAMLGGEGFRLLFTSRHRVSLGPGPLKVRPVDLGELTPSGCRKLRQLPRFREVGKLPEDAWQRALYHFGGHPKALELLEGFLREQPDRARQMLADMGPAVAAVGEDLKAEVQIKGRKLLVDNVLETVPDERRPAFDRLCLLEAPLPSEELDALLAAEGIVSATTDLIWLRDHGFLARTVAPSALAGGDAVHRLLASRQQEALAAREGAEAVRAWHLRLAEHLVERPGQLSDLGIAAWHLDVAEDRAGALDLYKQWALTLRNRDAYSACLQIAQEGLRRYPASENEALRVAAAELWVLKHDAFEPLGRIEEATKALDTAFGLVANGKSPEASFHRAGIQMLQGRLRAQAGSPLEAIERFEAARVGFETGGHQHERAVAVGEIARLRSRAGDIAAALKLHEEELKTYEQLGDVWSRAVALGEIARLRARAGDVAAALKLYEEELKTYEQLGDVRSRAVTLGDIARLRAQAGDVAGALKLHEETLQIVEQLGDVRSRAVTLGDIARLHAQAGDVAGALKLHEEELKTYEQLGDVRSRAVTLGDIARLRAQAGDVAAALKLHEERLQIFEQLGDVRERALTLGGIARLRAQEGDVTAALKLHEEKLAICRQLGDIDTIATALYDLAGLDLKQENRSQALERLAESWDIVRRLGRADGIAFVGQFYGQLLAPTDPSRALEILRTSRDAFQLLGMAVEFNELDELIRKLEHPEPSSPPRPSLWERLKSELTR